MSSKLLTHKVQSRELNKHFIILSESVMLRLRILLMSRLLSEFADCCRYWWRFNDSHFVERQKILRTLPTSPIVPKTIMKTPTIQNLGQLVKRKPNFIAYFCLTSCHWRLWKKCAELSWQLSAFLSETGHVIKKKKVVHKKTCMTSSQKLMYNGVPEKSTLNSWSRNLNQEFWPFGYLGHWI